MIFIEAFQSPDVFRMLGRSRTLVPWVDSWGSAKNRLRALWNTESPGYRHLAYAKDLKTWSSTVGSGVFLRVCKVRWRNDDARRHFGSGENARGMAWYGMA